MGYDVEIILMRQAASYLALPIFVVDPKGDLIYFNEPAEALLGVRYDETGEMRQDEWANGFVPTDDDGNVVPEDENPLVVALQEQRPAHSELWIQGRDGERRHLSVTAFPLIGQHDRNLGAAAIFWQDRTQ
jgi:PAS domain S-box-containing protein